MREPEFIIDWEAAYERAHKAVQTLREWLYYRGDPMACTSVAELEELLHLARTCGDPFPLKYIHPSSITAEPPPPKEEWITLPNRKDKE